jgi:hypothetical protein
LLSRTPRSPCLNPIENVFGYAEERLEERWIEKRPVDPAETLARFREICAAAAEAGDIKRTVASMPKRLKLVIDANGGPIRY